MAGKLALVAVAGLLGAAVLLPLGVGLSGRDLAGLSELLGGGPACGAVTGAERQVALPLASTGRLVIALPATIRYKPGGQAEVRVRGAAALVDHVRLEGDTLRLDCNQGWHGARLAVEVSGPAIADWTLLGSGKLDLPAVDQPALRLRLRGSGDIAAAGAAERVEVEVRGSGKARLKELAARSAEISIRGSGDAQLTAQTAADVSIRGSGTVELFGNPTLRRADIRGSGRIRQAS